jgi:hypothetical protein
MLQMPEMLSLSIKYPNFSGRGHTCWGNGTGGKIVGEGSYPKEVRVGEPNILCCLRLLYIEYS